MVGVVAAAESRSFCSVFAMWDAESAVIHYGLIIRWPCRCAGEESRVGRARGVLSDHLLDERRLSTNTLSAYRNDLRQFEGYLSQLARTPGGRCGRRNRAADRSDSRQLVVSSCSCGSAATRRPRLPARWQRSNRSFSISIEKGTFRPIPLPLSARPR